MDLTSKKEIRGLLKKYRVHPSKRLGQNFLIDKSVLNKIIKAANLKSKDTILEIGPGIGTLTIELAKKAKKVIADEKDPKMVEILKETTKDFKNIKIIQADILKINLNYRLPVTSCYKIIANLPYYITAPVIRKFLESKNQPKLMVLMVQKEVAQRICASPPHMNLLAVSVQFYSKSEIVSYVPKNSFWPVPKVDSAIIKITPNQMSMISTIVENIDKGGLVKFEKLFFKIVRAGFSHPRKQIFNNLSEGLALSLPNGLKLDKEKIRSWLLKNNIKPVQRAETLTIKDWINLTKSFKI